MNFFRPGTIAFTISPRDPRQGIFKPLLGEMVVLTESYHPTIWIPRIKGIFGSKPHLGGASWSAGRVEPNERFLPFNRPEDPGSILIQQ